MEHMHILSNRAHATLIKWAEGPQDTPQPEARSFCKQWSTNRSKPGERWQSFDQWSNGSKMNACPACREIAEGHERIERMILAGAERARIEATGQL